MLSTREVTDIAQAWHLVHCYQLRWHIEQLFRTFKKQGLGIESSQFDQPNAIIKQAIMGLKAASQVLQLTLARDGNNDIPIETVFDQRQQEVLPALNQKFEGNTQKQKNPHKPNTLAWAAWIIARLGGWKGYQSQRPPGPITFLRGIEKFNTILWSKTIFDSS